MADTVEVNKAKAFLPFAPWIAISFWWTIRLGTAGRMPFETGVTTGVLAHFFLLLAICLLFGFQRFVDPHLISRFKQTLRPAILYASLASVSTVCFHHVVCADTTALRQLERERFIDKSLSDDVAYAELQAQDERLAHMDRETARQNVLEGLRFQFDPMWHFTASLLMWVAAAMTTALFAAMMGQWLRG